VAYDVREGAEYGFRVGEYDISHPLIIDPKLELSTYVGGSGSDAAMGIAVDIHGNVCIAGYTSSTNFPTKNPYQVAYGTGAYDAFVTKLSPGGDSVVYSTYLGGSGSDQATGIAVDGSGQACVIGSTNSAAFPTVSAYQAAIGGDYDAFVTKLNAAGDGLVFSTYLGGAQEDLGSGITLDSSGNVYVTGQTYSNGFPTAGAPVQGARAGDRDAFVTKLSSAGAMVYSTFLGGINAEEAKAIAVDRSGNALITGFTRSSADFPLASACQPTFGGGTEDAFLSKLNSSGGALLFSTFLGGNSNECGYGVAFNTSGQVYVTGYTASSSFPTVNPCQASNSGGQDIFITKLTSAGDGLIYSTYLGGSGDDQGHGIWVDSLDNAHVAGYTASSNFPIKLPLQAAYGGAPSDAFLAKLNPSGSVLLYSTYLGGTAEDVGKGIAMHGGDFYVAGYTASADLPLRKPYQGTYAGGSYDAFVARISPVTKAKMIYFSPVHNLKE
jgi:hypothetical protein